MDACSAQLPSKALFTFPEATSKSSNSPHPWCHLVLSAFFITAILVGVKWQLIVVLICIFLTSNKIEHLLMYFSTICMSSFVKCQFMSFTLPVYKQLRYPTGPPPSPGLYKCFAKTLQGVWGFGGTSHLSPWMALQYNSLCSRLPIFQFVWPHCLWPKNLFLIALLGSVVIMGCESSPYWPVDCFNWGFY